MNFSTEQSSRHTQNRDRLTEGSRLVVTEGGGVGGGVVVDAEQMQTLTQRMGKQGPPVQHTSSVL